jgi:hypothetical protein
MPYMYVNLKTGKVTGSKSNPAEIGTLLLEFGTLSRLTGNEVFYQKAKRALTELFSRRSSIGLVGDEIDVETGEWTSTSSHVGGGIDSYYEYQLKCDKLFRDSDCRKMWRVSRSALSRYVADTAPFGLFYGEVDMKTGQRRSSTTGALEAFLPAVLALAGDKSQSERLEASAFKIWALNGLEPDSFDYREKKVLEAGYPLRPEIIESAYYLDHFTKDPRYLEMGRTFLKDIEGHCKTDAGFTVVKDVTTMEKGDEMPSFFLAETLKYLYLLFEPKALDFDQVVFNTEAHPLKKALGSAPRP